jgi:L-alanine-DL-glutamate epimerase-like enolase superfamily enzyme
VVRSLRDSLPEEVDLVVDASTMVDPDDMLGLTEQLAPLQVLWVELPLGGVSSGPENIGHRLSVPLAAARGTSVELMRSLVMHGRVDHMVVDVGLVGGLLAARQMASLAEIDHIGIVPTGAGPVALATALHLAAASPNLTMVEMRPGVAIIEDGTVPVDLRPGLGIDWPRAHAEVA